MKTTALCLLLFPVWAFADFTHKLDEAASLRLHGHYHRAFERLQATQAEAQTPAERARLAGAFGHVCHLLHQPVCGALSTAEQLRAAAASEALPPAERSVYANLLGSLLARDDPPAAAAAYRQALDLAGDDARLAAAAQLNLARLDPPAQRLQTLNRLAQAIVPLAVSADKIRLLLDVAAQAEGLGVAGLSLAHAALEQATQAARELGDKPLLAEALAQMGGLYERQGRLADAERLTGQALAQAQAGQDHALLWPVEAQLGRLAQAQGHDADALSAYRRAVAHIEAVRLDIPVEYDAEGASSFRRTLAPIYLALSDLLLRAARQSPEAGRQALLQETRDTVELAKQTELEDFLGDRCLVQGLRARAEAAGQRPDHAAVLYPVMLDDRLELLLDINGKIIQRQVPVTARRVAETAQALSASLREAEGLGYLPAAQALYGWLIQPVADDLRAGGVAVLVVVPDGPLRLVPLAALHDGRQFLLEQYALAMSPALTVLNADAAAQPTANALLAGLSEPGAAGAAAAFARSADPQAGAETRSAAFDAATLAKLQGHYRLPGVKQEIANLAGLVKHTELLDERFTVGAFAGQLAEGGYSAVHIASHGHFGGTAADTFVLAFDGVLGLDALAQALGSPANQRQGGLGLLTLSACETAQGDDRAPLGLSGVALRAHAHSAVGTLWPVNDRAARDVMTAFYRALVGGVGKAQALRSAQLQTLRDNNLSHPGYWSAFVLVGDWQ